jgi:hypothetical protein
MTTWLLLKAIFGAYQDKMIPNLEVTYDREVGEIAGISPQKLDTWRWVRDNR